MKMLPAAVTTMGVVAAAVLIAPTVATAQPADAGATNVSSNLVPVSDSGRGTTRMVAPDTASAIITAYWTPQRLAAAIPLDTAPATAPATASRGQNGSAAKPAGTPSVVAAPAAPVPGAIRPAVNFTNAEGKVFFHNPATGGDYSCSGGTVNSGKRRLVLTAGHCVHGGSGQQWMTNWVFYPGYQFGAGWAGAFPAYQLWAKTAWINNSNFSYDYAFAITQNGPSGTTVVDTVGGNGLIVNPGRPFVTAIAYPGNFNNGEQQAYCQGTLSARSIFNSDQQLNCDLRFGASGGPWMENYSDSTLLGYTVSNQSYSLNSDGSGPEYGPYYDSDTTSLYNAAETASP
jgi:V8-like Glu-specific endopeptidase